MFLFLVAPSIISWRTAANHEMCQISNIDFLRLTPNNTWNSCDFSTPPSRIMSSLVTFAHFQIPKWCTNALSYLWNHFWRISPSVAGAEEFPPSPTRLSIADAISHPPRPFPASPVIDTSASVRIHAANKKRVARLSGQTARTREVELNRLISRLDGKLVRRLRRKLGNGRGFGLSIRQCPIMELLIGRLLLEGVVRG